MKLSPKQICAFQKTIWGYYKKHGRQFPWRQTQNPYAILVSEVMLQQTQADRVVPFFTRWMRFFPTVLALARAPLRKALRVWSGLGYNRRALYLKRAAEIIVKEHGGKVPRPRKSSVGRFARASDLEKLDALPGVGPYTAAAILAFAWNEPTVFIETNIRTVYLHFFFRNRKKVSDGEIVKLVRQTLPVQRHSNLLENVGMSRGAASVREWYNALMDYGALLKARYWNPNVRSAHYAKQKKFAGSRRELRGEILRRAVRQETIAPSEFASDSFSVPDIFSELTREGFLRKEGRGFKLA